MSSSSSKTYIISVSCKLIPRLVPLTAIRPRFLPNRAEKKEAAVAEFVEMLENASKEVKEELEEVLKNRNDSSEDAESDNSDVPQIMGEGRRVCDWCRAMNIECEWKSGSGTSCESCKLHDLDCVVDGKALSGERRVGVIQPEDYEDDDEYAEGLYLATLEDRIVKIMKERRTLIEHKKKLTATIGQLHQVFRNLRME